jgi:ADP-ribose pyrophosphatase YjhB (NUDIX family)
VATDRRFCRFSHSPATAAFGMPEVPADGLCLCAFVVLSSEKHPSRVLLGKLNPAAPWDHLGALDPSRVVAWKDRWMLPSSHLLMLEDPRDAARRILEELVGLRARPLEGPIVTSEVYGPPRHPAAKQHWDLEFIFRGAVSEDEITPPDAWADLTFVDPSTLRPDEVARSQEDILAHAGYPIGDRGGADPSRPRGR